MEGSKGEKRLGPEVRGELRWGDFDEGVDPSVPLVGGFRLAPVPSTYRTLLKRVIHHNSGIFRHLFVFFRIKMPF